jgi:hypothetical protein
MESAGGPKSKTESKAQQSPPPPVAATTMVPEPHPDEPKEQAAAGANKAIINKNGK